MKSVRSIELLRALHFFIYQKTRRTTTMIKTVTSYFEYQILKVIGKNVRILHADDTTATIVIGK